ncbi:hypothetical protein BH11BAC3_BH11BAC3_42770 [soil metagenome]
MKTLKFKFIAVAIASFVMTVNTVSAQAVQASYTYKAEEPLSVKYLGSDGEYLLFEVAVNNETKVANFGITDKAEGDLYSYNFNKGVNTQKMKIEKKDYQELNFTLRVGKETYNKSFSVNTMRVENTVVAENEITRL